MSKSLMIEPPSEAQLRALPGGPMRRIKSAVLFSAEAMQRAWLKVKAVGGGPGIDLVSIDKFERDLDQNLSTLRHELLTGIYKPQPVKRLLAPKASGGLRPLALWTLRDKIAQRVVYDSIEPYFESQFLPCSFGFRPGRSIADVVSTVTANREANRRWVADIDIKNCFDSLDNRLLMKFVAQRIYVPLILKLIKAWLNAQVFNELSGVRAVAGASQGAVISPLLANIYLHQVDLVLSQRRLHLIRYADDMIVCCRTKAEAQQALNSTELALGKIRLKLNPHKSRIVHFDQGFKFLGVFFVKNEVYWL